MHFPEHSPTIDILLYGIQAIHIQAMHIESN